MTTLLEMRTRSRQRADMVNSRFIQDSELDYYINSSVKELYDLLIDTRGENYYIDSYSFATVPGTSEYSLPVDFLKLLGVDWVLQSNIAYNIKPFQWQERNIFTNPVWFTGYSGNVRYQIRGNSLSLTPVPSGSAQNIRIWYIPRCPDLASDTDSFDGINGWEEYVIIDAAIKMRVKEESPVQELMTAKEAMKQRIQQASKGRDSAAPPKVQDTDSSASGNRFFTWR